MWVSSADLPRGGGHPFYERLNRILEAAGFDAFVEGLCAQFYAAKMGRPSLAPGRYFRLLLIGYFEGLDSERAIAWRAVDSLSVRTFLRWRLRRTIRRSRVRGVCCRSKRIRRSSGLGIDATTLEANAAMRSIVRRDMAHKVEHAVDMETGAVVGVTIQGADKGDTATLVETLTTAAEQVEAVLPDGAGVEEVVADSSERGRRLQRRRGEMVERLFVHLYETGGMRRVYLRGHPNILKRLLVYVAGFNLGLLLRQVIGVGTPRGLQGRAVAGFGCGSGRLWASGTVWNGVDAIPARFDADRRAIAPPASSTSHLNAEDFCLDLFYLGRLNRWRSWLEGSILISLGETDLAS